MLALDGALSRDWDPMYRVLFAWLSSISYNVNIWAKSSTTIQEYSMQVHERRRVW